MGTLVGTLVGMIVGTLVGNTKNLMLQDDNNYALQDRARGALHDHHRHVSGTREKQNLKQMWKQFFLGGGGRITEARIGRLRREL